MRVSIARISTDGLIAATVTAQMETTITVTTRRRFHPDETYLASKSTMFRLQCGFVIQLCH